MATDGKGKGHRIVKRGEAGGRSVGGRRVVAEPNNHLARLIYIGGNTHECDNLEDAIGTVRCDYPAAPVGEPEYRGLDDGAHVTSRTVGPDTKIVAMIEQRCTCPLGDHARDAAVRLISVFRSWQEMEEDMQRTGYIPTIRDDDNAAPSQAHKDAAHLVRLACDAAGLKWSA